MWGNSVWKGIVGGGERSMVGSEMRARRRSTPGRVLQEAWGPLGLTASECIKRASKGGRSSRFHDNRMTGSFRDWVGSIGKYCRFGGGEAVALSAEGGWEEVRGGGVMQKKS